jgi:DNA-binding transcriptional MerR regulator
MQQEYTRLLSSILDQMGNTDHIRLSDIPDIDLYMDQVTTFMEDHLKNSKRYDSDKILTKTMINNYTKNKLLPPPVKKRYSPEHMLVLIFIYYFKSFLPLGDIQAILQPLTEHFFSSDDEFHIQDIYEEIYQMGRDQINETIRDIMDNFHTASHSFEDCPEESREYMQLFAFVCLLSFDIYLKKEVIQKMIDVMPSPTPDGKSSR